MNPERQQFLSLIRQSPARLTHDEAAWFLGFHPHEITILVSRRILRPIGDPTPKCPKYFAAIELERLRADMGWLARASRAVTLYRRDRNERHALRRRSRSRRKQRGQSL